MKINEFKNLCMQHKELQKQGKTEEATKIYSKLNPNNEWENELKITKNLTITLGTFEYQLEKFLEAKDKKVKFEDSRWQGKLYSTKLIMIDNDMYELSYIMNTKSKGYITLTELYKFDDRTFKNVKSRSGVQKILNDYPEFEEVLWACVERKLKRKKELELTENRKKLNEMNQELELLVSPAKREERVSLLLKLIERLKKENEEIEKSLIDVEINNETTQQKSTD